MSNIHAKVRLHRETNSFLQFSDEKLFAGSTKCYLIFKRSIDIFFSFLVLLFVFPWLLPVIILLIKFTSKGPAFFTQKRVGYRDNVFVCIKFRTMYVNNFADTRQAEPDDPRITRVGKFLRKSGMDELPQFINILTGDMSIIGPRPFMLNDYNHFVTIIPNYAFRNLVRPGITGLAQVRGFRGRTDSEKKIIGRYFWDSYYVKHIGFFTDLSVIFQTIKLLFIRKKTTDEKKTATGKQAIIKKIDDHPAQPSLSKLRY